MGNLDDALRLQEKHLAIANETNDKVAKTLAYSSLGKLCLFVCVCVSVCFCVYVKIYAYMPFLHVNGTLAEFH